MHTHTQKIRHGAALPPVATMQGGRCTTSPRLIFFGGLTFSTELFKPNGMKEKENIESWQITAYRRFAKLGRKHCARIIKRIPLGLQPVETIHCGRYATPSRLIFYEAIRLLPNYSNLTAWKNITFFSVTHSSKPLTKRSVISCSSGVRLTFLDFIWQKDIRMEAFKAYSCNF